MHTFTFSKFSSLSGIFERWIALIMFAKNVRRILSIKQMNEVKLLNHTMKSVANDIKNIFFTYGKSSGLVFRTLIASSFKLSNTSESIKLAMVYTSISLVASLFIFGTSSSKTWSCCSLARSNSSICFS